MKRKHNSNKKLRKSNNDLGLFEVELFGAPQNVQRITSINFAEKNKGSDSFKESDSYGSMI